MSGGNKWLVYLLLCQGSTLYTGCTNCLEKRWQAHLVGKGAKYTRSHKPLKVIYTEIQVSKSAALKRELEIKSWSRAQKIAQLQLAL